MGFLQWLFGTGNDRIDAVITDVTRMHGDRVCVAAMHQGRSIRLHDPQPGEQWLESIDGLAPGDVASLTWRPARRYRRPHSEDGIWSPTFFEKVGRLSADALRATLSSQAFSSIHKAFGMPKFYTERGSAGFRPDSGSRSLASLLVQSVRVYRSGNGVRADFVDSEDEWKMVPVVDLTLRDGRIPCGLKGDRGLLRVGLARPYKATDMPVGCYLQVNHVFPI